MVARKAIEKVAKEEQKTELVLSAEGKKIIEENQTAALA
jgi:hypothetical protein